MAYEYEVRDLLVKWLRSQGYSNIRECVKFRSIEVDVLALNKDALHAFELKAPLGVFERDWVLQTLVEQAVTRFFIADYVWVVVTENLYGKSEKGQNAFWKPYFSCCYSKKLGVILFDRSSRKFEVLREPQRADFPKISRREILVKLGIQQTLGGVR